MKTEKSDRIKTDFLNFIFKCFASRYFYNKNKYLSCWLEKVVLKIESDGSFIHSSNTQSLIYAKNR